MLGPGGGPGTSSVSGLATPKGLTLPGWNAGKKHLSAVIRRFDLDPSMSKPGANKGRRAGLQRWEEAITCFDRALDFAPQLAEAWYKEGTASRRCAAGKKPSDALTRRWFSTHTLPRRGEKRGPTSLPWNAGRKLLTASIRRWLSTRRMS